MVSQYHAADLNTRMSLMTHIRLIASTALACLAAVGTYASLAPSGFGSLAVVPAFFVAIVVLAPFAPRLS